MLRKVLAVLALAGLLAHPAAGFDSYWHAVCVQKAGTQLGFTEDAWKIMQLGNFSPDFFGPIADYASKNLRGQELEALNQSLAKDPRISGAAILLHFDNLSNELQSNLDFDRIFSRLLQNTQSLLAKYSLLQGDERVRKALILITL